MSRVVVVTGGGTGIGRAVGARFAADGDHVVLVGRRADVLEGAAKEIQAGRSENPAGVGRVSAVPADLAEPEQVERLRTWVEQNHGRVDVLVNAAGGNVEIGAAEAATTGVSGAAWHWTGNFRLNVLTAVLPTEGLKNLLADDARVLLFSSIAAFRGSGSGSYAGTKAALHPYAIDLAGQLGRRGITVNVVAPGYIAGTEFFRDRMSSDRERTLVEQTLNGRVGTVADVAQTAHWLASPSAGHITAQIVQVNGGAQAGR
jgi:3-oxoacyl-[acyl-carrier protein] reductase